MQGKERPVALLLLLAVALIAHPGLARELWVSSDGNWALEGWGYVKNQTLGMHFRDIALYTEGSGALSATRMRGALDLYWGDARLNVEHELSFQVASSALDGDGGTMSLGTTSADRPRLFDIDDIDGDGLLLNNSLDRLSLFFPIGPVDIRIGRQAVSWGSAWFWKPTDRFSPFSPMDIDPDVKRGVDAVRAEAFFGVSTSLDLIATFERHSDDDQPLWVHGGARFRTTLGRYDLALSVARFQLDNTSNLMAGVEFSGSLGDVGFRGEAAYNYLPETEEQDIEAVIGADYHFPFGLTIAGEVFYNGLGKSDSTDYAGLLLDPTSSTAQRIARGEAFHVGRYYAGLALTHEITPLLTATISSIANLGDPSALVIAGLSWSVVENGRVALGAMVPVGEKPNLTDAIDPMPSEFGLMPVLGYAVIKMSF